MALKNDLQQMAFKHAVATNFVAYRERYREPPRSPKYILKNQVNECCVPAENTFYRTPTNPG